MAYQPPVHLNNTYTDYSKKLNLSKKNEDLLDLGDFFGGSQPKKPDPKQKTSGQLFNPDDIMFSFNGTQKSNTRLSTFEDDDNDEIVKESTSLLNTKSYQQQSLSAAQTQLQSKQNMQKKKAVQSISSDKPKTLFQRFIFDPYKYQGFFDTTTEEILNKLVDALWPFIPENQRHLIENDAEQVREFTAKPNQNELYGPIWILATLIIELCILGHLQTVFSNSTYQGSMTHEELLAKQANYSLQKVFKTTFFLLLMFIVNPFIAYLVFKNKGAIEVTYASLLQIYGYSFAIFIPLSLVNCLLMPLNRLRIFLLISAGAISTYYIYKETKEFLTKYIDENTLKYIGGYIVGSTCLFMLLVRYYFLHA